MVCKRASGGEVFSGFGDRTAGGTEFTVTLQTIGPGAYSRPPSVSSGVVRFLDASQVSFTVPAGPTQQFRFVALIPGKAIGVFQNTGRTPTVEDTVNVR